MGCCEYDHEPPRSVVMLFRFFFFYRVYGCMVCILLFNSVSYVFLVLCLCIRFVCMLNSV